jgi:MFS family permease
VQIKNTSHLLKSRIQEFIERFHSGIWTISVINLIGAIGFALAVPFIALYLHLDRGASMTLVGVILLIGGLCSAAAQILGGELSDRFGRRPLLFASIIIRTLMYMVMAILMASSSPVWAIALAYILGQSIGMISMPITSAIVADLAPRRRLTEAYGVQRIGINLGWAVGPALGGYLATFLAYHWLFASGAAITALSLPIVYFFLRESFPGKTEHAGYRSMFSVTRSTVFMLFILLAFLVFLTMGQMLSTLSVFTVDRLGFSTAQYGLLLTINGLIVIAFQYPVARLLGRFLLSRALIIGALLFGLGYLLMGWAGGFLMAATSITIITVGEIIFSPAALSIVGKLSPVRSRGRYMGFFSLSQTLGWTTAPIIGGVLLDIFPSESLFIWGPVALLSFIAAFGYLLWSRIYQNKLAIQS